jgi:transcriptional regulator with XRE-family HTH domain
MAMIMTTMLTPLEVAQLISTAARNKRLSLNLSQPGLSERSGVSLGVLKKFEHTGQVSLGSLLKIALALDSLTDFVTLFKLTTPDTLRTLDELLQQKSRQRGRK